MAEPGRSLVADAGVLETEVVLVSQRDGVRWVYLDVGLFGGLVEAYGESIRYRIEVHRDGRPWPVRTARSSSPGRRATAWTSSTAVPYRLPLDLGRAIASGSCRPGPTRPSYSSVGFNGFAPLRATYR